MGNGGRKKKILKRSYPFQEEIPYPYKKSKLNQEQLKPEIEGMGLTNAPLLKTTDMEIEAPVLPPEVLLMIFDHSHWSVRKQLLFLSKDYHRWYIEHPSGGTLVYLDIVEKINQYACLPKDDKRLGLPLKLPNINNFLYKEFSYDKDLTIESLKGLDVVCLSNKHLPYLITLRMGKVTEDDRFSSPYFSYYGFSHSFSQLQELIISSDKKGEGLLNIREAVNLTSLKVNQVVFDVHILNALANMQKLKILWITNSVFCKNQVSTFSYLRNLEEFSLYNTLTPTQRLKYLSGLIKLTFLDISGTGTTNAGIKYLSTLTNLKYLNYHNNPKITTKGLKNLSHLTQLQMMY